MKRSISETFLEEFLEGSLSKLLNAVHNDTTLMMELRGNEVKIYYRGRLLVTVKNNSFCLLCNDSYWKEYDKCDELIEKPSIETFVNNIALYKAPIDIYLAKKKPYLEEQIKQQMVMENNIFGKNTEKTGDYFILDTEYSVKKARFDAIALKWPSTPSSRQKYNQLGITFLELKYNDGAKKGDSGIKEHIEDYMTFIKQKEYHDMCRDMEIIFYQKCKLGLIPAYNQYKKGNKISIDDEKHELVFILANSDPDGESDKDVWKEIKEEYKDEMNKINSIYFGCASNFGYGLFRYKNFGKSDEKDAYIKISDYYEKK